MEADSARILIIGYGEYMLNYEFSSIIYVHYAVSFLMLLFCLSSGKNHISLSYFL